MIQFLSILLCLHVVALHTSIAGMEIVSSLIGAVALVFGFKKRWRLRSIDWKLIGLLAAFVTWVVISTAFAPPVKGFWFQVGFMRWTLILVALTYALEQVWSQDFERKFVATWAGLTLVTGIYAITQCATGIDFIRDNAVAPQGGGIYKAAGFFSISLTFAYVYGLMSFGIFRPAMKLNPALGRGVIGIGAGGILASMSRGAWIAGLISAFIFIFAQSRKLVLPAVIAVGVVLGGLVWQGGGFATKITQMARLQMDNSASTRVDLWRAYGQMALEHPFIGVGIFNGDRYLPYYYAKLRIIQPFASHAHNNLLQIVAGTGVIGLILYLWVCGWFLRWAWRLRKSSPWGWSLFLAQVFVQIGGLTECNFIDGEVTHALILGWALTWMLNRGETRAA